MTDAPNHGAFVRELSPRLGGPVEELSARLMARIRANVARRYDSHATVDGYVITDRGRIIVRVEGPQSALVAKILRMLREEALATGGPQ